MENCKPFDLSVTSKHELDSVALHHKIQPSSGSPNDPSNLMSAESVEVVRNIHEVRQSVLEIISSRTLKVETAEVGSQTEAKITGCSCVNNMSTKTIHKANDTRQSNLRPKSPETAAVFGTDKFSPVDQERFRGFKEQFRGTYVTSTEQTEPLCLVNSAAVRTCGLSQEQSTPEKDRCCEEQSSKSRDDSDREPSTRMSPRHVTPDSSQACCFIKRKFFNVAKSSMHRSKFAKMDQSEPVVPSIKPSSSNSLSTDKLICRWHLCGSCFPLQDDLVAHVNNKHIEASRHSSSYICLWDGCPRIGRAFNARYKMQIHMRIHTFEKPHECRTCGKRFSRLENLKIHFRSHTGERPFTCSHEGCSKKFSNSSDRFKHQRTHLVRKPYVCKMPGCGKSYTDPSSLRKHVKTNSHNVYNC